MLDRTAYLGKAGEYFADLSLDRGTPSEVGVDGRFDRRFIFCNQTVQPLQAIAPFVPLCERSRVVGGPLNLKDNVQLGRCVGGVHAVSLVLGASCCLFMSF